MTPKSVIMIGGGIQEVEAVRIAQSIGLKVIVTDRNPDAPCFQYADYNAVIDGRDIEGLVAFALLNKEKLNIAGVFTLTELVTSVAAVALGAGFPGVPLESAVACQNKQLCKEIWKCKDIPTPEGGVVNSYEEAKRMFDKLGGKAFIKPMVGFGGKNAKRVLTEDDLEETFATFDCSSKPILMEELVVGSMHNLNAFFDLKGTFYPLGCFDRYFHPEYPVEIGACYPSQLDKEYVTELYSVTKKAAEALRIIIGPVKADVVLTKEGFKVLEMAPRLHGPKGSLWLTSFAGGLNHLEAALQVISGGSFDLENWVKPGKVSAYKALLPEPGYFRSISGIEEALNIDGVEKVLIFSEAGIFISEYNDSTKVPGYIFASGSSLKEANLRIAEAEKLINLETIRQEKVIL